MQNDWRSIQVRFPGIGCWATLIVIVWLLGSVGLGWIIKSALVLFALILILPVVAFIGLRFWFSRNLIQGACPVCAQPLTGLTVLATACPNCGTALQVTREGFQRTTADGTIDVQAVEVSVQEVSVQTIEPENNKRDQVQTIDVEVMRLPEAD
jgi:Zn finger protein HypA/HybF involved in hydrogenase expression